MWKKGDLSDFEHGMVVGARRAGLDLTFITKKSTFIEVVKPLGKTHLSLYSSSGCRHTRLTPK